jgi:CBS domain-containing protein
MQITDIMTTDVISVTPDMSLIEVAMLFKQRLISGAPVVDTDGISVGIITLSDFMYVLEGAYRSKPADGDEQTLEDFFDTERTHAVVSDVMTTRVKTLTLGDSVDDALGMVFKYKIHTLPVVDSEGHVVGIIGRHDIVDGAFHQA